MIVLFTKWVAEVSVVVSLSSPRASFVSSPLGIHFICKRAQLWVVYSTLEKSGATATVVFKLESVLEKRE